MINGITASLAQAARKIVEDSRAKAAEESAKNIAKLQEKMMKPAHSGTAPRNDQERKLAAMTPPIDKITHGDVLKGRGVKKEETQPQEVTLDEISQAKAQKYLDRAMGDHDHQDMGSRNASTKGERDQYAQKKKARQKGISRAMDRLYPKKEEVEQLDELSPSTLTSYRHKARNSELRNAETARRDSEISQQTTNPRVAAKSAAYAAQAQATAEKRRAGQLKATSRLSKEEVEQTDEAMSHQAATTMKHIKPGTLKQNYGDRQDAANIKPGIKGVADRLAMLDRAKKEGRLKEEIVNEAPIDGVAPGSMEGDKHMCATKVFHKEWKEGKPLFSQHADPDAEGNIAWYDVMFEHGIEKEVAITELQVLAQESHMHSKKKKM